MMRVFFHVLSMALRRIRARRVNAENVKPVSSTPTACSGAESGELSCFGPVLQLIVVFEGYVFRHPGSEQPPSACASLGVLLWLE